MGKLAVLFCVLATLLLSVLGNDEQAQRDNPGAYFHDPQNVHNKEHLKEHMSEHYQDNDMEDQVKLDSDEAMEFHYFKLHDYDGNNKLDGLELRLALTHFNNDENNDENNEENKEDQHENKEDKQFGMPTDDEEMATLIKSILKEDDLNDDGFIDYYEFIQAQKQREL